MKQLSIVVTAAWVFLATAHSVTAQLVVPNVTAAVEQQAGKPLVFVRVTNLASSPLEAWEILVDYELVSGRAQIKVTTDTSTSETPNNGAIAPGDTRRQVVGLPGAPLRASATVTMALFSDVTSEGSATSVAFVLQQRERQAKVLGLWIDALTATEGMSAAQGQQYLKRLLTEDPQFAQDQSNASVLMTRRLISELLESPDTGQLPDRVRSLKERFSRLRDAALHHKGR